MRDVRGSKVVLVAFPKRKAGAERQVIFVSFLSVGRPRLAATLFCPASSLYCSFGYIGVLEINFYG
jgi:hypothetical protein